LIVVLAVLIPVLITLSLHYFFPPRGNTPVYVSIREGESVSSVARQLEEKGVITSETIFRFLAWLEGKGSKIKAGDYLLYPGMHYGEVFDLLTRGPQIRARVTIPEGFTVRQILQRVGETGVISEEEMEGALSATDYQAALLPGEQRGNLEGLLFPKTYDLYAGMSAHDLVSTMLAQFERETQSLDWSAAERLGLTPYQVVIVASLIEREAMLDEERPLVAAVIYNRLKMGMLLQIDATVQYILPAWKEVLTYEDLKTPSPYNTYLHKGLPPAPICNPGIKSLEAALHPAEVDYLYYVATGKGGSHFFTSDYNEFLKAKNRNN
jgi:UPF0755 protein